MRYHLECPFRTLERIIEQIRKEAPVVIVDMHAEATSEKVALGHFVDGRVSAVFGTHTHIQTADEKVLPKGTAYITDLGMTGPYDSVIGQGKEDIIKRFLTSMPVKFPSGGKRCDCARRCHYGGRQNGQGAKNCARAEEIRVRGSDCKKKLKMCWFGWVDMLYYTCLL